MLAFLWQFTDVISVIRDVQNQRIAEFTSKVEQGEDKLSQLRQAGAKQKEYLKLCEMQIENIKHLEKLGCSHFARDLKFYQSEINLLQQT